MTNFEKILDFHKKFGAHIGNRDKSFTMPDKVKDLRLSLITEEFREVEEAFESEDHTHQIKELCDLLVVTYGTLVSMGVNADEAFDLVHVSNMSKLGDDGKPVFREDGKILKGPNYKPVDEIVFNDTKFDLNV